MSFNIGRLFFSASTPIFVIGVLALLAIFVLAIMAIARNSRKKSTAALELLRLLCTIFAVGMLWQAEWHTEIATKTQPEILVLHDQSKSMETIDTRTVVEGAATQTVVSRADAAKAIIENSELWKKLSNSNTVRIQGFSKEDEKKAAVEQGSDLSKPILDALASNSNLRAVVMLSDGDWNTGAAPVTAAQKLRGRDIPLFTIPLGTTERLPDLALVSVNAPTYGIIGEKVQIPFNIRSSLEKEVKTIVRIRDENGKERTKDITIPAKTDYFDSILWTLNKKGNTTLELSFPVDPAEEISKNNAQKFNISAREESIKVLVIETLPRWEYRFIRNALSRDPGVDVDCLLLHPDLGPGDGPKYIQEFPNKLEDLQKYDVVFLGDIGVGENQLTSEQAALLRGLVESQASGIVFIPGMKGNQFTLADSPLGELIPVILDDEHKTGMVEPVPSPMRLTDEGSKSLLTMLGDSEEENPLVWRGLPGFYWHAPIVKAKGGAEVLAIHNVTRNEYGRIPLIITREFGNGKVLYMGIDSAWRWRRGVEDLYHYRFWGQVARWMSYQRNIARGERVRVFYSPERPSPGDTLTFNANAFTEKGAPLTNGEVMIDITRPDEVTERIQLAAGEDQWGSYSGNFKAKLNGEYKIKSYVASAPNEFVESTILVRDAEIESVGQPARPEVLEEMARVAKGKSVQVSEIESIIGAISSIPEPKPLVDRFPLWSHWIAAAILVTLLGLFWIGRKLNGAF